MLASAVAGSIPPSRHRELHAVAARAVQLPELCAWHPALATASPSAGVAAELDEADGIGAVLWAERARAELARVRPRLTGHRTSSAPRLSGSSARPLSANGWRNK
jgi:hypothetical protein